MIFHAVLVCLTRFSNILLFTCSVGFYVYSSVIIYIWFILWCHFDSIYNFNKNQIICIDNHKFFWFSIEFITTWKYLNLWPAISHWQTLPHNAYPLKQRFRYFHVVINSIENQKNLWLSIQIIWFLLKSQYDWNIVEIGINIIILTSQTTCNSCYSWNNNVRLVFLGRHQSSQCTSW
jgi:hypothetical protein